SQDSRIDPGKSRKEAAYSLIEKRSLKERRISLIESQGSRIDTGKSRKEAAYSLIEKEIAHREKGFAHRKPRFAHRHW
ncbi:hypothetical protein, partial [Metabacillus arenae]|uniref:hypothetical protein n=1 Tax=Metabacillus arenae TaxID=2771434 RepID=UPI001CD18F40